MTLSIQPVNFDEAEVYIAKIHRHHRPPLGCRICLGVNDGEKLVGVLTAGRPVSRHLDDGVTLEVTRCCTDGTKNACSIPYAAAWRAAQAIGYSRMVTYTLPDEGGASLRAAGWVCVADVKATPWTNNTRVRADDHPICDKWRWEVRRVSTALRFPVPWVTKATVPDLFSGVGE